MKKAIALVGILVLGGVGGYFINQPETEYYENTVRVEALEEEVADLTRKLSIRNPRVDVTGTNATTVTPTPLQY